MALFAIVVAKGTKKYVKSRHFRYLGCREYVKISQVWRGQELGKVCVFRPRSLEVHCLEILGHWGVEWDPKWLPKLTFAGFWGGLFLSFFCCVCLVCIRLPVPVSIVRRSFVSGE